MSPAVFFQANHQRPITSTGEAVLFRPCFSVEHHAGAVLQCCGSEDCERWDVWKVYPEIPEIPEVQCHNKCCESLDVCRCSGRLQWDDICLRANIFRKNTHYGGKETTNKKTKLLFICFNEKMLKIMCKICIFSPCCTFCALTGEIKRPKHDGSHSQDCSRYLQLHLFHGSGPGISYQSISFKY